MVWFSLESKKRARLQRFENKNTDTDERLTNSSQERDCSRYYLKKRKLNTHDAEKSLEPEDDLNMFRNIRLRRSGVTKPAKTTKPTMDQILEDLKTMFPTVNPDTITIFLELSKGNIDDTIASLRNATSRYETITKDVRTTCTPRRTTRIEGGISSQLGQDTHKDIASYSESILESIEMPDGISSHDTNDFDGQIAPPLLSPIRTRFAPSMSPTPSLVDSGSCPSTALSTPLPSCEPEIPPSSLPDDTQQRKRRKGMKATQDDTVRISFSQVYSLEGYT